MSPPDLSTPFSATAILAGDNAQLATLLQQDMHERAPLADSWRDLRALVSP